jgi:hypothetical protein
MFKKMMEDYYTKIGMSILLHHYFIVFLCINLRLLGRCYDDFMSSKIVALSLVSNSLTPRGVKL